MNPNHFDANGAVPEPDDSNAPVILATPVQLTLFDETEMHDAADSFMAWLETTL